MSDECHHGSLRRSCEICERDEEIARLRAELDEVRSAGIELGKSLNEILILKDTRIAELEKENAWKASKYLLCGDYYPITEGQIDAAWKVVLVPANAYAVRQALSHLNIIPCSECGGQGRLDQEPQTGGCYPDQNPPCPACYRNGKSHGWVWKEPRKEEP
jgi:hypothetical protein